MNVGLRDMASIYNSTRKSEFQNPLLEFLSQFDDLERRCPSSYAPNTMRILKEAARFQKGILLEMSVIPSDLFTSDTVIALLLNCFVITHRNFDLYCNILRKQVDGNHYHFTVTEAHRDDQHGLVPFMAIRRQRSTPKLRESLINNGWDFGVTVGSALQRAAQLLLKSLIRQAPQDLPKILYALCIICLIHNNINITGDYISWQWSHRLADSHVSDLCRLYYICSYGGQPLTHRFDLKAYAYLVGSDGQLAIQHCGLLNALWTERGKFRVNEESIETS